MYYVPGYCRPNIIIFEYNDNLDVSLPMTCLSLLFISVMSFCLKHPLNKCKTIAERLVSTTKINK